MLLEQCCGGSKTTKPLDCIKDFIVQFAASQASTNPYIIFCFSHGILSNHKGLVDTLELAIDSR